MISSVVSASRMSRTSTRLVSDHLSHFAMCPAFPDSDYYWDSVVIGLAPLRRSQVSLTSYELAWVRSSTHPYARGSSPVSHHAGIPFAASEVPDYLGDRT